MLQTPSLEEQVVRACGPFEVDWHHARRVARLADRLFVDLRHLHGLTKTARPLLRAAALLHDVTLARGKQNHHLTAARLIPRLEIPALSAAGKRMAAAAVRLHPAEVRVGSLLESFAGNRRKYETEIAGRVAALLRIADGLDHGRSGATGIAAVRDHEKQIEILTGGGESAAVDTAFTASKTDFWDALALRPVRLRVAAEDEPPASALLRPEDTVAEAVRRILRREIEQIMSLEYGLAYDCDVEFVHEIRVATRRLRTAARIIRKGLGRRGEYLEEQLAVLAAALGKVRDADVLLLFLHDAASRAEPAPAALLDRLIRSERRARRAAYRDLLAVWHSEACSAFRDSLARTAAAPVGSPEGLRVAGTRASKPLWREARSSLRRRRRTLTRFGRDLASLSDTEKHRLRIACKKFRYTAEFFADVYPPKMKKLIGKLAAMQDLLGEVHDADVWTGRIRRWAEKRRAPTEIPGLPAALESLLERIAERKARRLREARKLWRRMTGPKRLRKVAAIVRAPLRSSAPVTPTDAA